MLNWIKSLIFIVDEPLFFKIRKLAKQEKIKISDEFWFTKEL